eukprot:8628919-Pyramimonas_sp.AAC.1
MSINTLTEAWPRSRASSESKSRWKTASTDVAPGRDPRRRHTGVVAPISWTVGVSAYPICGPTC